MKEGVSNPNDARILLIDDDEGIRNMFRMWLEFEGYEVCTACNCEEGLESLMEGSFDIVILDLTMPKMDGFEFCRIAKTDESLRSVPIVVLSSLSRSQVYSRVKEAGADAFVEKSSSIDELKAILRDMMITRVDKTDLPLPTTVEEFPS